MQSTSNHSPAEAAPKPDFWCFISYRHTDNKEPGRRWATWIHTALETYEVPPELAGKQNLRGETIPSRIFPVFRDETDLPANAELSRPIKAALESSRTLLVLCSPQAVKSRYVGEEIIHFKRIGGQDRILAAILEGIPNASDNPDATAAARECFPLPLRHVIDPRGGITSERTEPIAADFSLSDGTPGWTSEVAYQKALSAAGVSRKQAAESTSAYSQQQKLMLLKIVAGILGIPLGVLTQRQEAYEAEKALQRRRSLRNWWSLVGVFIVAAVIAGALAVHKNREANRQQWERTEVLRRQSESDHESGVLAARNGRTAESLAFFDRSLTANSSNTAALEASAAHAFGVNSSPWSVRLACQFNGAIKSVAVTPDGQVLAAGGEDKSLRLVDTTSGALIASVAAPDQINAVAFSPDGLLVAIASGAYPNSDGQLRVIERRTGKALVTLAIPALEEKRTRKTPMGEQHLWPVFGGWANAVYFSPDSSLVAVGCGHTNPSAGGIALIIDPHSGEQRMRQEFLGRVTGVEFTPDGRHLVAMSGNIMGHEEAELRVIDVAGGSSTKSLKSIDIFETMGLSPDGQLIAAGDGKKRVRIIETLSARELRTVSLGGQVSAVRFSPDGRYMVACCDDGSVTVLDPFSGQILSQTQLEKAALCVDFTPDGRAFATTGADKSIRIFELRTSRQIARMDIGGAGTSLAFSRDGRYLIAGGEDSVVRVLDAGCGGSDYQLLVEHPINSVSCSDDGVVRLAVERYQPGRGQIDYQIFEANRAAGSTRRLLSTHATPITLSLDGRYAISPDSNAGSLLIRDLVDGRDLSLAGCGRDVHSMSFAPGTSLLALGSGVFAHGEGLLADMSTGEVKCRISFDHPADTSSPLPAYVEQAATSSDGQLLAVAVADHTLRFIDSRTQKETSRIPAEDVSALCFNRDASLTAFAERGQTVRVLRTGNGTELFTVEMAARVHDLTFSPDDRHLAATSGDRVMLMDAATGKIISMIDCAGRVASLRFSPDGRCLIMAGGEADRRIDAAKPRSGAAQLLDSQWFTTSETATGAWRAALRLKFAAKFQRDGQLTPLAAAELVAAQEQVTAFVSSSPDESSQWQHQILAWAACTPEMRTVSPWTAEPLRLSVGQRLLTADQQSEIIAACVREAPWHVLVPAALLKLESPQPASADPAARTLALIRPRFLASQTLARLLGAGENLYDRATLARYATHAAAIAHEWPELNDVVIELLQFAVDRLPAPECQPQLALRDQLQAEQRAWSELTPEARTVSPWSDQHLRDLAAVNLMDSQASASSIAKWAGKAPWHPLVPLSQVRFVNAQEGAASVGNAAHSTLARLRKAPQTLYSPGTLVDYAMWTARILHEEFRLDAEAMDALAFAYELATPEQQPVILRYKQKIEPLKMPAPSNPAPSPSISTNWPPKIDPAIKEREPGPGTMAETPLWDLLIPIFKSPQAMDQLDPWQQGRIAELLANYSSCVHGPVRDIYGVKFAVVAKAINDFQSAIGLGAYNSDNLIHGKMLLALMSIYEAEFHHRIVIPRELPDEERDQRSRTARFSIGAASTWLIDHDKDGDWLLSQEEFRTLDIRIGNRRLNQTEVDALLNEADKNQDHTISVRELAPLAAGIANIGLTFGDGRTTSPR